MSESDLSTIDLGNDEVQPCPKFCLVLAINGTHS